jgi:predicted metalloprotease with PDZ domain
MLVTDVQIRKATKGKASLDDVALALLKQKQQDGVARQKDWIRVVGRYIGVPVASRMLKGILDGYLIIPPDDIGAGRTLIRRDREPLEIGFTSTESGDSDMVLTLVPGSRAAEAGLQIGDEILSSTQIGKILENFVMNMDLDLRRNGEVIHITYWPRSKMVCPCWEIQSRELNWAKVRKRSRRTKQRRGISKLFRSGTKFQIQDKGHRISG